MIWADDARDRWELFKSSWTRPNADSPRAGEFDLGAASRSGGGESPADFEFDQRTTLLPAISEPDVTRGAGSLVTPYDGAVLLGSKPTIRREPAEKGQTLPAVEAVLLRGKEELLRIPFEAGAQRVQWNSIRKLPTEMKDGLAPGVYQLRCPGPAGIEAVRFIVAKPSEGEAWLKAERALDTIVSSYNPVGSQVVVEKLLAHKPPYLCDALDRLDDPTSHSARLAELRRHAAERLKAPKQEPERLSASDPTGDARIDECRALIAGGRWEEALTKLSEVNGDATEAGRRVQGLRRLYEGVVYAESGTGREQEAATAFRDAIELFSELPSGKHDLFRAHNNTANFLLGSAQDRLQNHAFQIAAGSRLPLYSALTAWHEARRNYDAALAAAPTDVDRSAVRLNLARAFALLADIVRTLADPNSPNSGFTAAEQAASQQAEKLAKSIVDDAKLKDDYLRAVADELLARLAFRSGRTVEALSFAQRAYDRHLDRGSLVGLESSGRMLGMCYEKMGGELSATEALNRFRVSERLSEILRERYVADRSGLSRTGFFARRAHVTEHIVDLLTTLGRDAEALQEIEKSKANSLQEILAARRIDSAPQSLAPSADWSTRWPAGVTALEYFLGSEKAWVFVVDEAGKVRAHRLTDESGRPLASRDLVRRVQKFITYLDLLGPGSSTRAGEGRRIFRGGDFDWEWQTELHALYRILMPADVAGKLRRDQTCLIVPHHILHYFPFAALVTQPDSQAVDPRRMPLPKFLVDEPLDLTIAPSIASWWTLRQRPVRPLEQVQAVGVGDFAGEMTSLPGVEKELQNLGAVFGPRMRTVLTNENVTPAKVTALLAEPGIVSIATHGMKNPDTPLDSYFVCRDEQGGTVKLTAAALYESKVDADLIVLNACYGGFGDRSPLPGDDLYGIQRALLHSGARTVVSGLWDIYDATAPDIMKDFCQDVNAGRAAPVALARAQRNHLKTWREVPQQQLRFLTHPYYWAVFTVTGDDRTGLRTQAAGDPAARPITVASETKPTPPQEPAKKQPTTATPTATGTTPPKPTSTMPAAKPMATPKPSATKPAGATSTASQAESSTPLPAPTQSTKTTAIEPSTLHSEDDPDFARFVDLSDLPNAVAKSEAAFVADLALQCAEGERIVGRPRRGVSAADLYRLALRLAAANGDARTLARLKGLEGRLTSQASLPAEQLAAPASDVPAAPSKK